MTQDDILDLIKKDKWMMEVLRAAESLNLPDWWIGAGFVRSKVWDHLHGFKKRTPLSDIDLIYFDKKDFSENEEEKFSTKSEDRYQDKLHKLLPGVKWSVTNQARMHSYHKRSSYKNSEEALSEWVETATGIAVKLKKDKLILTAPHGIDDLVDLVIRPIPNYSKFFEHIPNEFSRRLKEKKWTEKWPKLRIAS